MPWFEKHWDMGDHQVQKLFATPPKKKKTSSYEEANNTYYSSNLGISKATKPFEVFLCTNWQSSRQEEEDQHPSKFS